MGETLYHNRFTSKSCYNIFYGPRSSLPIVVTGWEVFDTATNPPTSKLYIGGVEVTGYTVVPCSPSIKDREIISVCVDGKTWTKVVTFENDLPITFLWLDETDAPVAAPDPLLVDNANCNKCIQTPQGILNSWG